MSDSKKNRLHQIYEALSYVGKLLSTSVIIILLLVGIFLLYYLISAKIVSKTPGYEPKISLFTIVSGSMEPNIKVYDVIFNLRTKSPSDIHVGDVITFKSTSSISKDYTVTHRVIDIKITDGKYEFVTKGDNNPTADSDTAKYENVIGKVVLKIPQLGRIQFFLATKLGWFIIVLLPALGVIIYDILKVIKLMCTKNQSEKINGSLNNNDINKINEQNKELEAAMEKIRKNNYSSSLDSLKSYGKEEDKSQ